MPSVSYEATSAGKEVNRSPHVYLQHYDYDGADSVCRFDDNRACEHGLKENDPSIFTVAQLLP